MVVGGGSDWDKRREQREGMGLEILLVVEGG